MAAAKTPRDPSPLVVLEHAGNRLDKRYTRDLSYHRENPLPPLEETSARAARRVTWLAALAAKNDIARWPELADLAVSHWCAAHSIARRVGRGELTADRILPDGRSWPRVDAELSSATTFLEALGLALMRGDPAARTELAAVDVTLFDDRPNRPQLAHDRELARALIAVLRGEEGEANARVSAARAAAAHRVQTQKKSLADWTALLGVPPIEALAAILRGDADAADQALAEAFRQHRAFWGRDRAMNRGERPLRDHPDGKISTRIGGLMALARSRGLGPKVRSDYAPAELFQPPLD